MPVYQPARRFMEYTMHELSLAMSVREIVEDAAEKNNATKINEINIIVGEFSSVSVEALEFAMEAAKKDTIFENAVINIKSIKTVLLCSDCNAKSDMDDFVFICASCGSGAVTVISGDRMYVESIDIEK